MTIAKSANPVLPRQRITLMRRPDGQTLIHAALGMVAGVLGMSLAHLTAALLTPASSPVLAVGSTVIDATPTPVKEWAIRQFGTNDKAILIGNVLVVTLLLAAVAGVVSRRRPLTGTSILVALVALAGAAVLHRPLSRPIDVVPTLVAAAVGPAALLWMNRLVRHPVELSPEPTPQAAPSRRSVLFGAGVAVAVAALAAGGGQWIVKVRSRISDLVLPRPGQQLATLPVGLESQHPGISSFQTANSAFYRVDTKLAVPIVDHNSWALTIDGDVAHKLRFSYDDLLAMDLVERDITMTCVSNEVGGKLLGSARWTGVLLADLLDQAGIGTSSDQILSTDVEDFMISTPLLAATDGRGAMVAIGMNGAILPRAHGFPARLVVPGLYGFVGATKWLTKLTLTTYAAQTGYWTRRGWATEAPIKISSRIDTPRPLATITTGSQAIGGVAWAQPHGVSKVEVRIDDGPWRQATLGPDAGGDYWRQWFLLWDAPAGSHQLAVRAVDADGNVQVPTRTTPYPDGSSGIQHIVVQAS